MKPSSQKAFPYLDKKEVVNLKEELKKKYREQATPIAKSEIIQNLIGKYFKKQRNILDVGCANGLLFEFLHSRGYELTYGTDIADFIANTKPKKEFKPSDLNYDALPWADSYFQGISALEVYEHLENPFNFIREVSRALEPGGYFILTTPNPHHFFNKLSFLINGDFYRFSERNDHITLLTMPVFKKCVMKYFDLVETHYWKGEFPYRWFSKFSWPVNKYFGRSIIFVLKNKK